MTLRVWLISPAGFLILISAMMLLSPRTALAQFAQQGPKLVGSGAVGTAQQGFSVALSADGSTLIVGGNTDNNGFPGAAWVFTRSAGGWTQQGNKLLGSGAIGRAVQGFSVALSADGNTAIVGGHDDNGSAGAAWVYTRSGGVWAQQRDKLVGSGAVGEAFQGHAVALAADGNTAIVGGPADDDGTGAAWVFTRSGGVWTQEGGKLVGTGVVGDAFLGNSVALSADGNTAVVSGPGDNGGAGAVWVYTRSGGIWTEQSGKLVGTGAVGSAIQGAAALSADGNTLIVGGFFDNGEIGAAWVFTRSGGVWSQQGNKLIGGGAAGNPVHQGFSVALSADGNAAIVSGPEDNDGTGAAWVFCRSGGMWTQQGSKLIGAGAVGPASQGRSVAMSADGRTAIVGGFGDDGSLGAIWIFVRPTKGDCK
jgi:hypothetical protein